MKEDTGGLMKEEHSRQPPQLDNVVVMRDLANPGAFNNLQP